MKFVFEPLQNFQNIFLPSYDIEKKKRTPEIWKIFSHPPHFPENAATKYMENQFFLSFERKNFRVPPKKYLEQITYGPPPLKEIVFEKKFRIPEG